MVFQDFLGQTDTTVTIQELVPESKKKIQTLFGSPQWLGRKTRKFRLQMCLSDEHYLLDLVS